MAIREIRTIGDDILRKKCKEVKSFDEKLSILIDDLIDTVHKHEGAGLAAPQVGILKRVFVVDIGEGVTELVNPTFISGEGEQTDNEGCLSIPNESYDVTRPKKVKMSGFDRHGNPITVEGEDLMARALCHEYDHLDGVLYIDKADRTIEK